MNPGDPHTGAAPRRGPGPGLTGGTGVGVDERFMSVTPSPGRGAMDWSAVALDGHGPVTAAARRPAAGAAA